ITWSIMFSVGEIPSWDAFGSGGFPGIPCSSNAAIRRTIAERFDLLVLDEDGVTADPVVAADGAIQQFRVTDTAVVRLSVGQKRSLFKIFKLDCEDVGPGTFRG